MANTHDDVVLFHNTMRIHDGHLEDYRRAVDRAVGFVREHGPQLMVEVFIDEERMLGHSFQLHTGSESIRRHMAMSDPYIKDVMEYCEVADFRVYGDVDDDIAALLPEGATVLPRFTGFTRMPVG
ncbi:hypothetical protein O4J56_18710 [Nocardiopsis sp. RSe5-2]|uniref:Antibiotic biosynthesis monooxygenase n=1 Tax=Nocardiopsis endophytica TaxID=3018445 RepID=A0ABT4U6W1_9ACTN|nr:hypothetical protein [Nocardiopsis endophytica]MDA2812683.1 hypothetical protein [Nocardiopsis endophytica]